MMKVLFVSHWFPSKDRPQRGIFIKEQAKALAQVGVDVTVLHINVGPGKGLLSQSVEQHSEEGLNIFRINLTGKLWKFVYTVYPWQLYLVRKHLKRSKFDFSRFKLVHSHVIHPAGAIGHRLAKEHGLPHFIGEQWSNVNHYFSKFLFKKWGKQAYDGALRIFVLSKFLKKTVELHVANPSKIHVVPNVVSAEEFFYRPAAIGSSYYVVMAASWNRGKRIIKRPKLLIKAVAEASKELDKPIIFGIIGDGDRLPEMKDYCRQLEVHGQFHGFMTKQQVATEFQKADLFMHGSEYETFSVVIAEALKCGTPVVASNVAAIPELVTEGCGLLVDNTVTPWKDAIVKALTTNYDRSAIAESFKKRFGYQEVGNMLVDHYNDELGQSAGNQV